MSVEEKNKGGRPPGKETPAALVGRDLKQTLQLQKQIRDLLEKQFHRIEKELSKDSLGLTDRLKAMEALANINEVLTKGVTSTAKWVMPSEVTMQETEVNAEKVLSELIGGRG